MSSSARTTARSIPIHLTMEEVRSSTIRVQLNNLNTVIALAQRTFGAAYQFVPPMSVTLGVKECPAAARVRLFSDTGPWKQTALRVALFGPPTPEYPITLLQELPPPLLSGGLLHRRCSMRTGPGTPENKLFWVRSVGDIPKTFMSTNDPE